MLTLVQKLLTLGVYPLSLRVSSVSLKPHLNGVYTQDDRSKNGRPRWKQDGGDNYIQISMENVWTVVEGSSVLAEGKVALRSVDSYLEQPPYTGWQVESDGSFVSEPAVTVKGGSFVIFLLNLPHN